MNGKLRYRVKVIWYKGRLGVDCGYFVSGFSIFILMDIDKEEIYDGDVNILLTLLDNFKSLYFHIVF